MWVHHSSDNSEEGSEVADTGSEAFSTAAHDDQLLQLSERANAFKKIISSVPQEDVDRDGLVDTPDRCARAFSFFTEGYSKTPAEVIGDAIFKQEEDHGDRNDDEMIIVQNIDVFSLCEHHMIPFFGKAHIAYIPNRERGSIIGLSKLGRLTDVFARRLQVQERLTKQIMQALQDVLQPSGVGVILECRHMCMEMRGVQKASASTITRARCGRFVEDSTKWAEFETCIFRGKNTTNDDVDYYEACTVEGSVCAPETAGTMSSMTSSVNLSTAQKSFRQEQLDSAMKSEADVYRLYQSCADDEFTAIINIIHESLRGPAKEKRDRHSILDIGAGNGRLLEKLCSKGKVSYYTAFEKDEDLCDELKATVSKLGFDSSNSTIRSETFSTAIKLTHLADVVLLSHSLYGTESKESMVQHALKFVAPGGILLIFHRWNLGGTLDCLSQELGAQSILHELRTFAVELDLKDVDTKGRILLSKYTKGSIPESGTDNKISRTLGYLAIEPHSGAVLGRTKHTVDAIKNARRNVSYAARTKNPVAVIIPQTVVGIKACLRAASLRTFGCSGITVMGGGHSANCFANGAIAIDMQLWDHVVVDRSSLTVRVGGGATIGAITMECEKFGMAVPLGDRPGVGMGLVLQGGLNHLMRSHGLACDNILRVEYITPSGELQVAENEKDLLPFRGAGTNFGVVLELTLQAYKLESIFAQLTEYALGAQSDDSRVLSSYSEVALKLPNTACVDGYIYWACHEKVAFATSLFSTEKEPINASSLSDVISTTASTSVLVSGVPATHTPSKLFDQELYMTDSFDPRRVVFSDNAIPQKLRSLKRCLLLPPLDSIIGSTLTHAVRTAPTKWCYIHILHGGGATKDVSRSVSAFGCRDWNFAAVFTARYPDGDRDLEKATTRWLKETVHKLLPHATGVYGSDLGPSDYDLAKRAFGHNSLLLANMKRRRDPLDVLRCGCPLLGGPDEAVLNDPRIQNSGVVVIFCGRRCAGKDWLAQIAEKTIRELIGGEHTCGTVSTVCISDQTKFAFANAYPDVNAKLLMHDRNYKEAHRMSLNEFYEAKKASDPAYDAKCFVEAIQSSNASIVLLTGMRDGLEYARRLAGRAVVMVKVDASEDAKRSRGWTPDPNIDLLPGECNAESQKASFWDLVYENNHESTVQSSVDWAKAKLSPAILRRCVRHLPDRPQPGVVYKDLVGGPMLQSFGVALSSALFTNWLHQRAARFDLIVAPEAMGYVFAGAVAARMRKPLALARKPGKLPGDVLKVGYEGSNIHNLILGGCNNESVLEPFSFELVTGSIQPDQEVLIVDDCLATGSTADALERLVRLQGGVVKTCVCVMEFTDLHGRTILEKRGISVFSLLQFDGK